MLLPLFRTSLLSILPLLFSSTWLVVVVVVYRVDVDVVCSCYCQCIQAALDFESGTTSYTLKVDVVGELSKQVTVTISVTNVNEAPRPSAVSISVPENTAVTSVLVSSIPSLDPDAGAIATYTFDDGNSDG